MIATAVSLFEEPKVDCHCHVLDPRRFAYDPASPYHPSGAEIGTPAQLGRVLEGHGVRHALLVQPNSGYGADNACMLATIAAGAGRYKGVAVVPADAGIEALAALAARGIVGVAWNATFHGVGHYLGAGRLAARLAELGLVLQVQTEADQLVELLPVLTAAPVRLLIDHCGRPRAAGGPGQPGFRALLRLGGTGRAAVKLSGFMKFSQQDHPWQDTRPYVAGLVDAFGLDNCMWGSDWPFLRATQRHDYGPLLAHAAALFPDPADRRRLFWETPRRLFGFAG